MTETAAPPPQASSAGARLLVDIGPLVVWIVAYNVASRTRPDEAVFIATGVYVAATLVALLYARIKEKRWPLMLLVTAVIVTMFGAAAIVFHNALFAYIKPTIIYSLFAVGIFGSLIVKQNVLKLLLNSAYTLPDQAWRTLAIRWGVFFFFLAVLNEVVWRNFSEAFWANFKLFGLLPLVFLFALAQTPFVLKHGGVGEPEKKTGPAE